MEAVCNGELPRTLRDDGVFGWRCGVFVTLHVAHRLRGCIGVIETPNHAVGPTVNVRADVKLSQMKTSDDRARLIERQENRQTQAGEETGLIASMEPLGQSIVRCAATAALGDPRFPPLRPADLPSLQIEISLLSRPFPIRPEDILLGRHGIIVRASAAGLRPASPGRNTREPLSAGETVRPVAPSGPPTPNLQRRPAVFVAGFRQGVLLPQVAVEHNFTLKQFLAEVCRKADLPAEAWRRTETVGDSCLIELLAFTSHVFSDAGVMHS